MEYVDKTLKCIEEVCGHKEFVVTAGEQSFFASKGYSIPKRCKECRVAKKASYEARERSPFTPILNQMRSHDRPEFRGRDEGGYGKERKGKKDWKRNRRHGREGVGTFEGT